MALTPLTATAANQGSRDWSKLGNLTIQQIQPSFNPEDLRNAQINAGVYGSLSKVLGGTVPTLKRADSVPNGAHGYADPATNTYYLDPTAYDALATETSPLHSGAVNGLPHEMAHLRQIAEILASKPDSEGGAQAFADYVTPTAARAAGTSYDTTLNYDGAYAPYVQQAMQKGLAWILGQQFGHPPVQIP